jgi:PAS domain S-box-containing protein
MNPRTAAEAAEAMEREQSRAETRVQESETRFRIMADVAPVMLWMAREDSMCTFFNQTWLDFTGRTQEQEWGVGWAESIHFEDLQRCLDTYVDAFGQRRVFEMEYRLRRADGEYRWILDRGTPRYTSAGVFAGYIGSCIDITDRRHVEVALRDALRGKQEFLALASHELRSPVAALRLQLERFRRVSGEGLDDAQREILERMGGSTDRLADLIDSVVQFSRLQDGSVTTEHEHFELGALVGKLVDATRPSAMRKGLALRHQAPTGPTAVVSDPSVVRAVVSRLLGNAVKFTDEGSIDVAIEPDGAAHRVVVRDTGHGMSAADQARVFDPFSHLESARNKHKPGIGLGLPVARRLATLIGGTIALQSEAGRGSTFTLTVPVHAPGSRDDVV